MHLRKIFLPAAVLSALLTPDPTSACDKTNCPHRAPAPSASATPAGGIGSTDNTGFGDETPAAPETPPGGYADNITKTEEEQEAERLRQLAEAHRRENGRQQGRERINWLNPVKEDPENVSPGSPGNPTARLPRPSPESPQLPLPGPVRTYPDIIRDHYENGRPDLAQELIRNALSRYPDDAGVKMMARLYERKVPPGDSKLMQKKIDPLALGTREPEALSPALALGVNPGPAAASARAFAVLPGPSGLSPAAAAQAALDPGGRPMRGASAPVLDAIAKFKLKDYQAVEAGLARHLERHPGDGKAWGVLATSRYQEKRYDPSIAAADKALEIDPRDEVARNIKTLDLIALERYQDARNEASLALELNPRDARAYINRSEALRALGLDEAALADLKAAAELDAAYQSLYEDALGTGKARPRGAASPFFSKRAALWLGALGTAILFFSFVVFPKLRDATTRSAMRREDQALAQSPSSGELSRRYDVQGNLGQGGMGEVFKAVDRELHRPVALKRLRRDIAGHPRERDRFEKEARLSAKAQHAGIVQIYTTFRDGEDLYLVLEYVAGRSLHEELGDGALAAPKALAYLRQMSAALDYAHGLGVIHQDLKPANVMVAGETVKIMDFGIARCVQETLSTLSRVEISGTPTYMAPEQETGGVIGPATDQFAFGVCAYEMLTGKLPFPQGGLAAKLQRLYRPASSVLTLPSAVDAVLAKALAPDPLHRYSNTRTFVDDLTKAMS